MGGGRCSCVLALDEGTSRSASPSSYIEGIRARARRDTERAAAWRTEAMERARSAAEQLRSRFGVVRVILFGSLARGEGGVGSDVDLYVDGLPTERILEAMVVADRAMGSVAPYCDLVPSQWARPEIAERAEAEGIRLVG